MACDSQLAFTFRARGGKRKGAGRPAKGNVAGVSHLRRPSLSRHHPVHVTLRIAAGVPSLRQGRLFEEVRFALAAGRERFGFRLVRFSVQSDHLHLIVEAQDSRALALGMQASRCAWREPPIEHWRAVGGCLPIATIAEP